MSEDFLAWAGLTPERWAVLMEKLRQLARTERTAAKIMRALQEDINIGHREQLVLAYWLGYLQASLKCGKPVSFQEQQLKARLN